MIKSKILLLLLVFFIGGIFVRSFLEIPSNFYFLGFVLPIMFVTIFYKNSKAALVAFLLLFFTFGAWMTDGAILKTKNLSLTEKMIQANVVVQKNSQSKFGQNLIVDFPKEEILVLVQVSQYPEYKYGDLLEISCILREIKNLSAEQAGKDVSFDYRAYMAKDGVLYACENEKIVKIGENAGNRLYAGILKTRLILEQKILTKIPQPEGSLASGILFGGSVGLTKEIQEAFSKTGMTHIVAVSGYNVTIIAQYLILLGIWFGLWRRQAIWFAIAGIFLFVVMIGLPASAVRAGVMSGILLWAMKHGRLADCENAIVFAASIMLLFNPLLLRWDIGFQLSFLATLGIVLTSSWWENVFIKKHKAFGISEIIALSISAQIFVLPIIAYNFQTVSLVSLLANVLILPIVPLSMLLAFLVLMMDLFSSALALIFAWLAFLPLHYEIKVIKTLADLSWASIKIEKVSPWHMILYYSILCVGLFFINRMQNLKIKMENDKLKC